MRSMTSEDGVGETNTTIQGKELYELEVRLKGKIPEGKAIAYNNVHKEFLHKTYHKSKSVQVRF